ncbi:hypothetical protein MASR2M78_02610 [Treponema sp.]
MNIAVPSWVIPGTYVENLGLLAAQEAINTVELLFFIYDEETRSLLNSEWDRIGDFSERFHFTAHLPDKLQEGHEELVERLNPLVDHFIIHPPIAEKAEKSASLLSSWIDRYDQDRKQRFLLENIHPGRLEALLPLLPEAGICLDTGHLLLQEGSPSAFFAQGGSRIGEIHLHGLDTSAAARDGRLADHRSLQEDMNWLHDFLPQLGSFAGVINLEVFSWAEAERSIQTLKNLGVLP